jgi:hypothetical protein
VWVHRCIDGAVRGEGRRRGEGRMLDGGLWRRSMAGGRGWSEVGDEPDGGALLSAAGR